MKKLIVVIIWMMAVTIQLPAQQTGNMIIRSPQNDTLVTLIGYLPESEIFFGPFDVSGNYLYSIVNGKVKVFDISDPASPVFKKEYETECCVSDMHAAGNILYVTGPQGKLIVFDISDPVNIVEIAALFLDNELYGTALSGNYLYVTVNTGKLIIVDVNDPYNPAIVSSSALPQGPLDVGYTDHFACVANSRDGLLIYDVSDPENPVQTGSVIPLTMSLSLGVYVKGQYAYVTTGNNGLYVIDISNPEEPQVAGSLVLGFTARLGGHDNFIYVPGDNTLYMLDISDPGSPVIAGTYTSNRINAAKTRCVRSKNQYIYVSEEESFLILQNDLISGTAKQFVPDNVKLYPNPAMGEFRVRSPEFGDGNAVIELYGLDGRKLLEKQIPKGTDKINIDVSMLQSGLYLCRINTEKGSVTKKLIVK